MSDNSVEKFERRHHTPDEIINGKPKWSKAVIVREKVSKKDETQNKTINIDRLNPTRAEMEELDDNFGDDAGIDIKVFECVSIC